MKNLIRALLCFCVHGICFAQQPYTVSGNLAKIHDPRPVAALADLIQERYGVPVNYEDIRTVFAGDIVDETAPQARLRNPQALALGRKWGTLEVTLVSPASTVEERLPQAKALIADALAQHVSRGQNGMFDVTGGARGLYLIPKLSRGRDGKLAMSTSPLDLFIVIPPARMTAEQCFDTIVSKLNETGAVKIIPGIQPSNFLIQATGICEAQNEPARDVVERVLRFTRPGEAVGPTTTTRSERPVFVWRLLYDIKLETYALNIVPAMKLVRSRFGGHDYTEITTTP